MRYQPEHKAEIRQKIVKDAARRVRTEGLAGAAVSAVMRDAGLTHVDDTQAFEEKFQVMEQVDGATVIDAIKQHLEAQR